MCTACEMEPEVAIALAVAEDAAEPFDPAGLPVEDREARRTWYRLALAVGHYVQCPCGIVYVPSDGEGSLLLRGRCYSCEGQFLDSIVRSIVERLGRKKAKKALPPPGQGEVRQPGDVPRASSKAPYGDTSSVGGPGSSASKGHHHGSHRVHPPPGPRPWRRARGPRVVAALGKLLLNGPLGDRRPRPPDGRAGRCRRRRVARRGRRRAGDGGLHRLPARRRRDVGGVVRSRRLSRRRDLA